MDVPSNTVYLAMVFEGFYAKPYICPAGLYTIGFGRRCSKDHPPITREQGEAYLAEDLQIALHATIRFCPGLIFEPEGRLGAITDFTFNLGAGRLQASTLRRKINQGAYNEVPDQLMRWVCGGGRVLKGLVLRRQAEAAYFI
jgi:lysozyme